MLRSQKVTRALQVGQTSVVSGSTPLECKLPVQGLVDWLNPEHTIMVPNNLPAPVDGHHHPISPTCSHQVSTIGNYVQTDYVVEKHC